MPSGESSVSENPFDGGDGGGPLGGGGGGGSFARPEPNTDKSWQTASVQVPDHLQPLSPAGGGLRGSARGGPVPVRGAVCVGLGLVVVAAALL